MANNAKYSVMNARKYSCSIGIYELKCKMMQYVAWWMNTKKNRTSTSSNGCIAWWMYAKNKFAWLKHAKNR